jgi:hypothetical protein
VYFSTPTNATYFIQVSLIVRAMDNITVRKSEMRAAMLAWHRIAEIDV